MLRQSGAGPARPSARAAALAGLASLAVAVGIARFAFTPILPMMQADAGLSVPQGAWLASANYLGYLFGALTAIRLRMQPAQAIRASLLVICASTLAMGLVHGFAQWLVLRAVAGIASAWVLVFVSVWSLEHLAAAGRSNLGGKVYAGVGAGILGAGLACLAGMRLQVHSAEMWIALALLSGLVSAALWPLLRPAGAAAPVPAQEAEDPQIHAAGRWELVLCYGAFGFGYIVPATFLPSMAKRIIADPQLFGWAWPLFGAAALASTLLAARLARALSHRTVWVAGQLVMALGVVAPLVVPALPGILLSAALVGGTFMVVTMAGMQEARRVAGTRAGTLMAAMTSAFATGQILGPLCVSGLAGSGDGFAASLLFASAVLAASTLLLARGRTRR